MGVTKRVPADPSLASPIAARVLVIDENPDHQLLAVTALVPRGFEVKSASTAREGRCGDPERAFGTVARSYRVRDSSSLRLAGPLLRSPRPPREAIRGHESAVQCEGT